MKWLQGTAHNIRHAFTEEEKVILTVIELVMIASEPRSKMLSNKIARVNGVSDFRVCMTPTEARSLAKALTEYAEQAERQAEKIEVKND
jgi:hypothetical protein